MSGEDPAPRSAVVSPSSSWRSPGDRARRGEEARRRTPHETLAAIPGEGRSSPAVILRGQIPSRLPELVPIRHERMLASPFAFYRGAAAVMAADLARTPTSGLQAQLCGDAHLSNFGLFASPERRLLFDLNDFDETCPGPFEWDVKRLAASLVVAGRVNGFSRKQTRKVVTAAAQRYHEAMAGFAALGNLAVWYARVDVADERRRLGDQLDAATGRRLDKAVARARRRGHRRSLMKLTETVDGHRRIISDPPFVVPLWDLAPDVDRDELEGQVVELVRLYSSTLEPGHRELLRSYTFVDMARKVVGVGSVGTRCWIVLLRGRDDDDPLFLQVKEAQPSVLAPYVALTNHRSEGARVVAGQRIMQSAGDVFLGWQRTVGLDGVTRDFYVRQLQDWKGAVDIERLTPQRMLLYGRLCAWTLARAHARSGDRVAIAAYLGDGVAFTTAVAAFADGYADLTEQDHAAFAEAVGHGELTPVA